FLEDHARYPWRFSFSIIKSAPEPDFFTLQDVFTGETFLLYSPGIRTTIGERGVSLWFNLIGFNGQCWETYGPIVGYSGVDVDDIFFFASELNLDISCDEELVEALNRNPVPFMMLITGAAYPLTLHKKDEIIFAIGDLDVPSFDLDVLKSYFKIEYAPEVYRLTLEGWGEFPHYATGYYHEGAGQLLLTAMTDRGYSALV